MLFVTLLLLVIVPTSAQDDDKNDNLINDLYATNARLSENAAPASRPQPSRELDAPRSFTPEVALDPSVRDRLPISNIPESGEIWALILLEGEPALRSVPANSDLRNVSVANTVTTAAANISAAQRALSSTLRANFGIQTVSSIRYTANAISVIMDASQIEEIRNLPGVIDVVPDQIGYLDNATSVPFIGGQQVWQATGYTGNGIRIGIIDSGIDYTHANFGGSGSVATYNSQAPATPGGGSADISDIGFDGSKVVGGYDFVGDGWISGSPIGGGGSPLGSAWNFTFGDNDPIDCNGHGSHVAGTAAGFGVDSSGNTYTGPWNNATPLSTMDIGPGVAPEATLYAMKIGDCSPSVSFIAAASAIDFAIDPNGDGNPSDRLDVINNSYGGAYGTPQEVLVSQFDLAAQNGIVVVGAAGNEGDTYFINGDPNIAEWSIAVASVRHDTTYMGLELTTGPAGVYSSYPAVIPANPSQGGAPGIFGPYSLRLVGGTGNNQGCASGDYAGFAGEVGVINWTSAPSGCGSGTRMTNAVNAGGVAGLIVISSDPGNFPFINLACTYSGGPSSIPCVSITAADGANLLANLSAYTVRFDDSLQASLSTPIGDTLSGFSSRGPRINGGTGEVVLKPDIAAPGDSVFSTDVGTGNGGNTSGGTSMAAPHVAGAAALVRQVNPSWDATEIKAVLMNTATHDVYEGPVSGTGNQYGLTRVGAGRVDVRAATLSPVIAYHSAHPERVSVSFGFVEVVDTYTQTETITVENKGSTTQTYNISFQQMNDTPGVQFTVSPAQVTVPAGGTVTVTVTLTANKLNMTSVTPDPTVSATQPGAFGSLPRHRMFEEGGYVVLTPTGSVPTLRVPVYTTIRPASAMAADSTMYIGQLDFGLGALNLNGIDLNTGGYAIPDVTSLVNAMELVYEHPVSQPSGFASGDIQYIGITSDFYAVFSLCGGDLTCAINNTTIYFGIVTYGEWSTMSGFETWFDIGIDNDEDGSYDFTAFTFESGFLGGGDFTDTFLSWLAAGGSWLLGSGTPFTASYINDYSAAALETYVMNNNVIVMPVSAADMGLTTTNTDFQFDVLALSSFFFADWLPDTSPFWISYDITTPAYVFNDLNGIFGGPYLGSGLWDDLDGYQIPVDYDVTGLPNPLPSILLLHHHNGEPINRPQVVQVVRTTQTDGGVIKSVDDDVPTEGQTITFDIEIYNNGPGPVEEPVIEDLLPTGLTYVSDTCPNPSTITPVAGGTLITCDFAGTGLNIPQGVNLFIQVVATVDAGTSGTTLTNTASLTGMIAGMTDTDPSNDVASVNVCVDGTAGQCNPGPTVAAAYENSGISLFGTPVLGNPGINQLTVVFDQPVVGGIGLDGAANEDNYRVLAEGTTPGFQTATCNAPVDSGDYEINTNVTYNTGTYTSTLTLVNPAQFVPLPEGNYRLIVCGSTSIIGLNGVPLDGNGDGIAGDDAVFDFSVNFQTGVIGSGVQDPSLLGVTELPATGETPQWRNHLMVAGIALATALVMLGGWFGLRKMRA
ncbi:MAG: hypothetical protein Kow00117_04620 [Phototrophicales bacterium]